MYNKKSYKLKLPIGTKVRICDVPPWLRIRREYGYCHLYPLFDGTIIGYTAAGDKVAIETDMFMWSLKSDGTRSSYDNGCHGKGKLGKCAYFLPGHFVVIDPRFDPATGNWDENKAALESKGFYNLGITYLEDPDELLLLLY